MVIRFILEAIRGIPQAYREDRGIFLLTLVFVLVATVYHLVYAVRICRDIRQPVLKFIVFIIEFLGSFALLLSSVVFVRVGEIAELNPEMLNRRFFLEIIICAIFYCVFIARAYFKNEKAEDALKAAGKWNEEKSTELANRQADSILKGIAIIIMSLIGVFTGTGIVRFGPVLFGKTIGAWIFSLYVGWTTSVLATFIYGIIELIPVLIIGNRNKAFLDDMENTMEKVSDSVVEKGFDSYDQYYGGKSAAEKKGIRTKLLAVLLAILAFVLIFSFVRHRKSSTSATVISFTSKSIEELTKMAEDGDADAQMELGYRYLYGFNTEENREQAMYWFVRAAEAGNAEAQRTVGFFYALGGNETAPNYEEALRWSMAAAEQGNALACMDIGYLYEEGHGVEKSAEEAEKWYVRAVEGGCINACSSIGFLYLCPEEPEQADSVTAASWFARGAEGGDPNCAVNLGVLYEEGNGVEQNYEKAAELYMQAAEGDYGYASAKYHLGILYENGWGVSVSKEEALRWYKAAADQNHADALQAYNRLQGS